MTVATLRLDLRLGHCDSLREKRRRMRAITGRLHRHFNVALADDDRDDPAHGLLVVATVGRNRREARETLERVADAIAAHPRADVLSQAITES